MDIINIEIIKRFIIVPFSEFQTPISSHLLEVGWASVGGRRFIIFNSTYFSDPSELKAIVWGLFEREEGILQTVSSSSYFSVQSTRVDILSVRS